MFWQNVISFEHKEMVQKLPRRKDSLSAKEWKSQILAFTRKHRVWKGNEAKSSNFQGKMIFFSDFYSQPNNHS